MITNTAFTGGASDEAGLFEELMRSVKSHLNLEYEKERIKGTEYANVYLTAIQTAMQVASQFTLSKDLQNQQELLLQAQVIGQEKQNLLLDAQIAKLEADTALSVKQLDLLDEQVALAIQQTAKVTQDTVNVTKQIEIGTKQIAVMDSSINQAEAQTSLITQQEQNVLAEYANIAKTGLQLDANVAILNQKKLTEEAQTEGTTESVQGILGKQMALYQAQTDGYARDAEQKTAKIYADFYNVNRSTDADIYPSKYGANGTNVIDVLDILRAGIGVKATDRTVTETD